MTDWLESANGALALLLAILGSLWGLWRLLLKPLLALAARAQDVEDIRKALTPNSGTSMHDFVEDTRKAVSRVEHALAEHCKDAGKRMDGITDGVAATNLRIDRLSDSLAGVRMRREDRAGIRTRAADEEQG